MPAKKFTSNLETDAAKVETARVLTEEFSAKTREYDDVVSKLIDDIGTRAVANQYLYALHKHEGNLSITGTLKSYFERTGEFDYNGDNLIGIVIPADEQVEAYWEFPDDKTLKQAVRTLHDAGFQWSAAFQNKVDKSLTKEIAATYAPASTKTGFNKTASKKKTPKMKASPKNRSPRK